MSPTMEMRGKFGSNGPYFVSTIRTTVTRHGVFVAASEHAVSSVICSFKYWGEAATRR